MTPTFEVLTPDPEFGIKNFTVTGVAPDGQPSHYDIENRVRDQFPGIKFDSEAGQFFAYTDDENEGKRLAGVLNALFGRPVLDDEARGADYCARAGFHLMSSAGHCIDCGISEQNVPAKVEVEFTKAEFGILLDALQSYSGSFDATQLRDKLARVNYDLAVREDANRED